MRIVSGKCKGRQIVPPSNLEARPTTDFAKESLFNILNNTYEFDDLKVLDLFSGTGSISYEFASRGASRVISIEMNPVHHKFISSTAAKMNLEAISALRGDSFAFIRSCNDKFDIIFADPPYDLEGIDALPELIMNRGLLVPGGWFIFEHSKGKDFSDSPYFLMKKSYGSVNFSFFEAPEQK